MPNSLPEHLRMKTEDAAEWDVKVLRKLLKHFTLDTIQGKLGVGNPSSNLDFATAAEIERIVKQQVLIMDLEEFGCADGSMRARFWTVSRQGNFCVFLFTHSKGEVLSMQHESSTLDTIMEHEIMKITPAREPASRVDLLEKIRQRLLELNEVRKKRQAVIDGQLGLLELLTGVART